MLISSRNLFRMIESECIPNLKHFIQSQYIAIALWAAIMAQSSCPCLNSYCEVNPHILEAIIVPLKDFHTQVVKPLQC